MLQAAFNRSADRQNGGLMLGEGPVVNEVTDLFCHVNESLGFLLECLFYLLMVAVNKGVELLAGVAGVDRIVGAARMNRESAGADVTDVLSIDDASDGSFWNRISAPHNFPG